MVTHSSVLAGRIPWTEEPVGLQYLGSQRVRHNWATNLATFTLHLVYRIKLCKFDRKTTTAHNFLGTGCLSKIYTDHTQASSQVILGSVMAEVKLKGLDHFYPQNISSIRNDMKAWTKDDSEPPWPLSRVKAQGWCKWCWQPIEWEVYAPQGFPR